MKNNKKHIDRLFQEGLKNFEATPNPSVWENIKTQLNDNKKKRKVIPLWLKLSGVAAGLLLLFTLANNRFLKNTHTVPQNEIIVDTKPADEQNINDADNSLNTNTLNRKKDLVDEDPHSKKEVNMSSKSIGKHERVVAKNNSKTPTNSLKLNILNTNESAEQETTNAIVSNSENNKAVISQKNSVKKELLKTPNTNTTIANNKNIEIPKDQPTNIKEPSIEDAIAENINAKEDLETDDNVAKRWSVAPNIAPVYFNTLGEGSSIHPEFDHNSKTGDVNVSYGISASYAVNDKINLRIGINTVTLGYSTHNVIGVNSSANQPIKSINVKNIAVSKSVSNPSYTNVSGMSFAQVPETFSKEFNASINQELGFLEIPLEIQYNITNTKLGVNAIGGFSALFLNNNNIYSSLDGKNTLIGKATNINNLSYSANLGLGFNYKISRRVNINLEPMFKYQLNTFKNTSGNFKPYFIGVYSGLSFKF